MTTLVVDGNNILARSAFAAKGSRAHMSVDGVNTAALTIFINMLSKYVKQVSPTHMAVCWDAGHRIRDEIYPEYKAKRAKHVDDGEDDDQTPWGQAKEFCTLAGIARSQWEVERRAGRIHPLVIGIRSLRVPFTDYLAWVADRQAAANAKGGVQ